MTGIRSEYGGRRNAMYDAYLGKVRTLLEQLVVCGAHKEAPLIARVRGNLASMTPIHMGVPEGLLVQAGVAEMFCRLARFDTFAQEVAAVEKMVPKSVGGKWFADDVERIDLSFLTDVHELAKASAAALRSAYKLPE